MNILTTECPIKSWMNSMEKMVGNIIIDPYKLLYNKALLKLGFKHHFLG